jgi:hypothetical protein
MVTCASITLFPEWSRSRTATTLQIHGASQRYNLQGGSVVLAELFSNRTTPSGYASVVGSPNGTSVAFTYDLARNIAYTRQGNPANANLDIDNDGCNGRWTFHGRKDP